MRMSEADETPTREQHQQKVEVDGEAYAQARQMMSQEVIPVVLERLLIDSVSVVNNPRPAPAHPIDQKFEEITKHNHPANQDKTKSQPGSLKHPSERISSSLNFQDELNPLMQLSSLEVSRDEEGPLSTPRPSSNNRTLQSLQTL